MKIGQVVTPYISMQKSSPLDIYAPKKLPLSDNEKKKYLKLITQEHEELNEERLKSMEKLQYPGFKWDEVQNKPVATGKYNEPKIESSFEWNLPIDNSNYTIRKIVHVKQNLSGKIIGVAESK